MLGAFGFRSTKWKRLSLNTNVTAIQHPPFDEISPISWYSSVREEDRGSLIGNIAPNSKDKTLASDSDREKSKLNSHSTTSTKVAESLRPRQRALLVGVTYKNCRYKLKGTTNDVKNMRNFLIDSFSFNPQNILVLTEDETEPDLIPTKKNILISLKWLVKDCRAGDSLVFYYSGHGLRQPDFDSYNDGFDETICPVDFLTEGMILDYDINSAIVRPLPKDVTLHAIVDACYCGTILDLPYVYDRQTKAWEDNYAPSGARKQTNGGLAISICRCVDDQMLADTSAFNTKAMNGVMTYNLIDINLRYPGVTYGDMLDLMHGSIEEANQNGCLTSRLLRTSCQKPIPKPVLSSSETFDVYGKNFIL
ncbi:hypothetical protein P3X46_013466 [Hevea brasiliensis]|uniref:Peptidase C14 caspase domain-containing protein n=1 Tax=Hevea brasiliensis TaxID=3981 RepID=A0ABQ9M3T5_HEVBR|nr:metacaspase-1-like [Hevea brasiliensis]KAJ9174866.1 hypothetical protein P3X46_013466 [Hevea brasiliensis]